MHSIPDDWIRAQVHDVVDPQRRVTYGIVQPGPPQREEDGIPIIRGQDYSSGVVTSEGLYHVLPHIAASYSRSTVKSGDLLLSIVGYVGATAQIPPELDGANLTQTTARIAIKPPLSSRYFLHFFRSGAFRDEVNRFTKGSAQPGLNLSDVEVMRVSYPPCPEQRQIAEILDTLDEAIRKTEAIIEKLKQAKQGLLHDLLRRGIDDNGELRDPERHPEQFKDSPLGRIPKEWETRKLRAIAEVRSGIAKNSNLVVRDAVRVPYLRVANVQDGYLDLAEMAQIEISRSDLERYRVLAGDVLMNEGGDLDKLGRGVLWRGEYDPCVHQNHVFVVRSGREIVPSFLDVWTGSDAARRYFMMAGKQTTNLASINKTALGRLPVVVPSVREQSGIVQVIDAHQRRSAAEIRELLKLQLTKKGLMEDLLTGRVRVTSLINEAAE